MKVLDELDTAARLGGTPGDRLGLAGVHQPGVLRTRLAWEGHLIQPAARRKQHAAAAVGVPAGVRRRKRIERDMIEDLSTGESAPRQPQGNGHRCGIGARTDQRAADQMKPSSAILPGGNNSESRIFPRRIAGRSRPRLSPRRADEARADPSETSSRHTHDSAGMYGSSPRDGSRSSASARGRSCRSGRRRCPHPP